VEGVGDDSLALGVLDDAVTAVVLLDESLELDEDGSGAGAVDVLGVGVPLADGVPVELLPLEIGSLLLGMPLSDDDGVDELLDAAASPLDPLDELLSADDELDDEEPGADELGVGSLLGGSALDDGKLSLLDGESELDDELLGGSEIELDGAELDEELPLEDGWLLDDELDELLALSDEELLLELLDDGWLDEGWLDDGSLLLLDDG
jgi:hypothetical protein